MFELENWAENLYNTTMIALLKLWEGFLNFIPALVAAIIIFLIGWFIAVFVGRVVSEILIRIKLNQLFEKTGWKTALEKADIKISPSDFIGAIVKLILMITFLYAAVGILGEPFEVFQNLLRDILRYLPNVVVAAFIFVVAVIIADIIEKVVRTAVEGIKMGYGHLVGAIIKWAIWIFAILMILQQLGFAAADDISNLIFDLIKIVFMGIIVMLAIAFGLGGKEVAAEILQDLRKKLKG